MERVGTFTILVCVKTRHCKPALTLTNTSRKEMLLEVDISRVKWRLSCRLLIIETKRSISQVWLAITNESSQNGNNEGACIAHRIERLYWLTFTDSVSASQKMLKMKWKVKKWSYKSCHLSSHRSKSPHAATKPQTFLGASFPLGHGVTCSSSHWGVQRASKVEVGYPEENFQKIPWKCLLASGPVGCP